MRKASAIQKIKLLQSIKPSKEWSAKTRSILLSQITAQGSRATNTGFASAAKAYGLTFWNDLYAATLGTAFSRPRNAFATAAVFAIVGVFAYVQAQQSLPGDPLYTVKQSEETIKVALTTPEERPALELSLIERRIQELETLTQRPLEQGEKEKQVQALVENVSGKFKNVQNNLTAIRSQETPKRVVGIASLVKEKSSAYRQVLKERVATSTPALAHTISEALATADSTKTKALEVIVDKGREGGVSESEVAAHLTESIKEVEHTAKQLKQTVSMAALSSAKRVLKEAKEHVKQKEFKVALRKLAQGRGLVSEAEAEIQGSFAIKERNEGGASATSTNPHDGESATSTPSTKIKLVF